MNPSENNLKIGIVGATGAVGQELIRLLHERGFEYSELVPLASARSAGKTVTYEDKSWIVQEARPEAFDGLDVAIFSAGGSITKELAPQAAGRNCIVVDNSSAFRMDEAVPLVVPEINGHVLESNAAKIIANPNCTTAITLMGLYPLHREFGLTRIIASTYQAVSGSGAEAIEELRSQAKAILGGGEYPPKVYPNQIAFNLLPQVDVFLEDGYTKEEMKMLHESRKIMGLPDLQVSCTCIRVPVFRAHSISVTAQFEKKPCIDTAHQAIEAFPGVELRDDPANGVYPMPLDYSEKNDCGVGRIRHDAALENALALWVVGDQLWKGAALNAIQICEALRKYGRI